MLPRLSAPRESPSPASFETGDAAVVDIVDEITVDTAVEAASAEDAREVCFPQLRGQKLRRAGGFRPIVGGIAHWQLAMSWLASNGI